MKKIALAGLAMSAAVAAGAHAEPLTLTGDQLDKVTAAGAAHVTTFVDVYQTKTIDVNERLDIKKSVDANVFTFGHLATAQSDANCAYGVFGCIAETYTVTDVNFKGDGKHGGYWDATSHSQAVSATGSPADAIFFALEVNKAAE